MNYPIKDFDNLRIKELGLKKQRTITFTNNGKSVHLTTEEEVHNVLDRVIHDGGIWGSNEESYFYLTWPCLVTISR